MFFLLDNYDSFVYNLSAYFQELGQEILVKRPNEITLSEIEAMHPEGIILSPGPGHPSGAAFSQQVIGKFKNKIPVLGVCLGHQTLGYYFGAKVSRGSRPMHGKVTDIFLAENELFRGLPKKHKITRYHSLVISQEQLPDEISITARAEDGAVMGIAHRKFPLYGVQFHPEAVLTEHGHGLLNNFIAICREWRGYYENN